MSEQDTDLPMVAVEILERLLKDHFYKETNGGMHWRWREDFGLDDVDKELNDAILVWADAHGVKT